MPNVIYSEHMGTTEKPVLSLVMNSELLARVDAFWHENQLISRSEAIRWLIQAALDKKLKPAKGSAKGD
jgi:metal-responsive CopG/Arc/MetJ family transcriptional regulator